MPAFPSIRLFSPIKYISPLCAPRVLPGPHSVPLRTYGVWAGCYHAASVIGTARTAVMRLCGAMLCPAAIAAGSGSGPLLLGILGRMLGSDSRLALTIVPMLPHNNPFIQVGPDGELRAVDVTLMTRSLHVRGKYGFHMLSSELHSTYRGHWPITVYAIIACHVACPTYFDP
jgi:hypothetical protein